MKKIDLCIGTDQNRNIRIRLSLIFIDPDTGKQLSEQYHSAVLSPGDNLQSLRDALESHLADANGGIPGSPWPKIPDAEWNEVIEIVRILHTPQRILERVGRDQKAAERFVGKKLNQ